MIKFLRHERCYGFSIGRYELWIASSHYKITPHTHPNDDSTIVHLFSNSILHRVRNGVEKTIRVKPFSNMFKKFTLLGTDLHWFETFSLPLIFLNIGKSKRLNSSNNFKTII